MDWWWTGWRAAAAACVAAVVGVAVGVAVTAAVTGGSSGSSAEAQHAEQLLRSIGNLFSGVYTPDFAVEGVPSGFPATVVDVARQATGAELVGGFAMPNGAGTGPVAVVLWTPGSAVDAVPKVRDAAVAAGWRKSPAFLSEPGSGAGAILCGNGAAKPAFLVEGVAQNGHQVLTLRLMPPVTQGPSPCPAGS